MTQPIGVHEGVRRLEAFVIAVSIGKTEKVTLVPITGKIASLGKLKSYIGYHNSQHCQFGVRLGYDVVLSKIWFKTCLVMVTE